VWDARGTRAVGSRRKSARAYATMHSAHRPLLPTPSPMMESHRWARGLPNGSERLGKTDANFGRVFSLAVERWAGCRLYIGAPEGDTSHS